MAVVPCIHAAMPLVTQYIAPVGNPTWEAAVAKTGYGQDEGFSFRCVLNSNNVDYSNYLIKIGNQYLAAWNKWVCFSLPAGSPTLKDVYVRSATTPTNAPPRRYLYPVVTNVVETSGHLTGVPRSGSSSVGIVSDDAWLLPAEKLVISNGLDSSPYCTPEDATYVQCVHTDWLYQVTFDANGGGGSMDQNPFVYTNSASLPPNAFVKAGYRFSGWNDAPDGSGARYVDGQKIQSTDLPLLYAQWDVNTYTVLFSKSNEEGVTGEMEPQVFTYGEAQALSSNRFVRTGYGFLGWSTVEGSSVEYLDGQVVSNLTHAGEHAKVTLFARWGQNGYSLALDPQGGTGGTREVTANYGVVVPDVVPPTRDGYAFGGYWSESDGGGEQYIDKNGNGMKEWRIASSRVLYAKWSEIFHPVSFHANGGSFADGEPDATIDDMYHIGLPYGELPVPEPSTNTLSFAGWWTSTDPTNRIQVIAADVATDSVTDLYARWKTVPEANLCSLKFTWGGKLHGSMSTNAVIGTEFGRYFPSPSPTDEVGRVVFGWYDGSRRILDTDTVQGDATLTGKWTFGEFNEIFGCYDIIFDSIGNGAARWSVNDGGVAQSGAVGSPADGSTSTLLMTPEKPGTLSVELKTSCYADVSYNSLDFYVGDSPQGDGAITNLCGVMEDFVRSAETRIDAGEQVKLEYYRWDDDYRHGDDCSWARNLIWIPDQEPSAIDDWESFASVTSSVYGAYWTTGGAETWATVETDRSIVAAGSIDNGCSSWIRLDVPASAGVLEFEWRVSGETGYFDTNGVHVACDYLEFVDESCRTEGLMDDFVKVVVTNYDAVAHAFTWKFVKDGDVSLGDDGAWLRNVVWTPGEYDPPVPGVAASATGCSVAYDGEGHGITVSVTSPESGATVAYALSEDGPYGAVAPLFTNAVATSVWYMVSADGYLPLTDSCSVTILQAANGWTVEPAMSGWQEGDEASEPSGRALFGECAVDYAEAGGGSFGPARPSAAGSYIARFIVEETANWTGLSTNVAFEIAAMPYATNSWTVPPSIEGWTEGDAPSAPVYGAAYGDVVVDYAPKGGEDFVETPPVAAGTYVARFTVAESGSWSGLSELVEFVVAERVPPCPIWPDDAEFGGTAALTYDGWLVNADTGAIEGTLQVKTAKKNSSTGVFTATATVVDSDSKTWRYSKGVGDGESGIVSGLVCTAKNVPVPAFGVTLGANGLSGEWGGRDIIGARNGMGTAKDDMKSRLEQSYKRSWSVAFVSGEGVSRIRLQVGAGGSTRLTGTAATGSSVSATVQSVMGEDALYVPYKGDMLLELSPDGSVACLWSGFGDMVAGGLTETDDIGEVKYAESAVSKGGEPFSAVVSVDDLAYPVRFSASGLPAGLKINATTGEISGTPTKPGSYRATITVTSSSNSKTKATATVSFEIGNYADPSVPVDDSYGPYRVGVKVYRELADVAEGCTASGLPAGLKFSTKAVKDTVYGFGMVPAYVLYGVPTRAVTNTVYFQKGKRKSSATFRVEGLDPWAQGTFSGPVVQGDGEVCGLVQSATVSAAGKVGGKMILADGGSYALSSSGYDSYDAGVYEATVVGKKSKIVFTNKVTVVAEPFGDGVRGRMEGEGELLEWSAWQNLWKADPLKTEAKRFASRKLTVYVDEAGGFSELQGENDIGSVALSFASSGEVRAAGRFSCVNPSTGGAVTYSASCSSTVVPTGDAYLVFLHFPAKVTKTVGFDGFAAEVPLVWNGTTFVLAPSE